MRPTHIDEIAGQKHIIGEDTALYKMIKSGKVPSILLYGEPGIGKTSIANAIAGTANVNFEIINATNSGVKDIEEIVKRAEKNGPTVLAIDEVHRFNKTQQDKLLPHVEKGLITLVGMTTENPYHRVQPAVRSRCGVIKQLKRLEPKDIIDVLKRALNDPGKGLGDMQISVSDEILHLIATGTNGEVRSSLNVLEMAAYAADDGVISETTVKEFLEHKGFNHDRDSDGHYNALSAFQKSIRGSDVDAALHYLARLIEAGDDTSIIRRLKVIAFEDISISDPETVIFVCQACDSVRELGFPEARIPLAAAVVKLCLTTKSNSAHVALDLAIADIKAGNVGEIPMHLRDTHYASASKLGHVGYKYPHDYPQANMGGWVKQQYLPDLLKDRKYYTPIDAGKEKFNAQVYQIIEEQKKKK
jgi:putative ATPase